MTSYVKRPEELLQTINPKSIQDIVASQNPSIVKLINENGEPIIKALMVDLIADIISFFSLGKSMNATQVTQTVDLILEEYCQYKFDDWKLCFKMAKLGKFGTVYDRIDGNVIFQWFDQYLEIRFNEFEAIRAKENRILNEPVKADPTPMPDYIKELMVKKSVKNEIERSPVLSEQQVLINSWIKEFDKLWESQGSESGKRFIQFEGQRIDIAEFLNIKSCQ